MTGWVKLILICSSDLISCVHIVHAEYWHNWRSHDRGHQLLVSVVLGDVPSSRCVIYLSSSVQHLTFTMRVH